MPGCRSSPMRGPRSAWPTRRGRASTRRATPEPPPGICAGHARWIVARPSWPSWSTWATPRWPTATRSRACARSRAGPAGPSSARRRTRRWPSRRKRASTSPTAGARWPSSPRCCWPRARRWMPAPPSWWTSTRPRWARAAATTARSTGRAPPPSRSPWPRPSANRSTATRSARPTARSTWRSTTRSPRTTRTIWPTSA